MLIQFFCIDVLRYTVRVGNIFVVLEVFGLHMCINGRYLHYDFLIMWYINSQGKQ